MKFSLIDKAPLFNPVKYAPAKFLANCVFTRVMLCAKLVSPRVINSLQKAQVNFPYPKDAIASKAD